MKFVILLNWYFLIFDLYVFLACFMVFGIKKFPAFAGRESAE